MKFRIISILIFIFFTGCVGTSTVGVFGSGVSIALDPRTLGTQIDDSVMQKNLGARVILLDKKYFINVRIKVIDGHIFIKGKVNEPEEKLKITKAAWETKGARSVKNNIVIKEKFSFKNNALDVLITSQLKAAMIFSKKINASNFNIDTINQKIYIYGIAQNIEEKREVITEAKLINDVKDIITSIILVKNLTRQKT